MQLLQNLRDPAYDFRLSILSNDHVSNGKQAIKYDKINYCENLFAAIYYALQSNVIKVVHCSRYTSTVFSPSAIPEAIVY